MRIESLTFFRFVAALIVVTFHFGQKATGWSGFLVAGPQMVTFFFVLSGFVMAVAYGGRDEVRLAPYIWKRMARIAPLYWIALSAVVALQLVRDSWLGLDAQTLFLNFTLLQSWAPGVQSLNHPGWSLSVELFFYLSFPWLLMVCRWGMKHARVLLLGALLFWFVTQWGLSRILSGTQSVTSGMFVDYSPLVHYCSFALGVVGGLTFMERKLAGTSGLGAFSGTCASGALIVTCLNHPEAVEALVGRPLAFRSSFYAPLFLIFILSVAASRWGWSERLAARPLVLLGKASYSLYILQLPVFQLHVMYLRPHLDGGKAVDFSIYLSILIFVSVLAYLFIEKPANRLLRFSRTTS